MLTIFFFFYLFEFTEETTCEITQSNPLWVYFADDRIQHSIINFMYMVAELDPGISKPLCVPLYGNSIYEVPLQGRGHQ